METEAPESGEVLEDPQISQEQAEMEALRQQLAEATQKYSTLSATHQRAIEDGRAIRGQADVLTSLMGRFEQLEENQALMYDRLNVDTRAWDETGVGELGIPGTVPAGSQSATAKLAADRAKRAAEKLEADQKAADDARFESDKSLFLQACMEAGIDPLKDQQFVTEVLQVTRGPAEATAKIPAFLKRRAAAEAAKQVSQKAKQEAAEAGELEISKSTPSGSAKRTWTAAEVGDYQTYKKYKAEIDTAYREGRVR